MDLKKEILKEHSKAQTEKVVRYVANNPKRFKQLVVVFLEGPYRVTQRAAWPISNCVKNYPVLIKPHLGSLLKVLDRNDIHDAVKRNILRLLQYIEIPTKYHGIVTAHCFRLINVKQPIAVRAFSMTVLANIARHEPDLKKELQIVIEDQLIQASPGVLSRAKKVLKEIAK